VRYFSFLVKHGVFIVVVIVVDLFQTTFVSGILMKRKEKKYFLRLKRHKRISLEEPLEPLRSLPRELREGLTQDSFSFSFYGISGTTPCGVDKAFGAESLHLSSIDLFKRKG